MREGFLGIIAALLAAAPAMAESEVSAPPRPVVLELFVSQNCGACMTANAALAALATGPDVLALTYDVDYWDYLGWRDTLAHPDFTQRQRAYADRFGLAHVYTPQMVVDGREAGPGGDGSRIQSDIKICREAAARAPRLTARREGREVAIEIGAGEAPVQGAEIWLVGFEPGQVTTRIGGGENAGRDFTVLNPVREVEMVGHWRGEADQLRVRAPHTARFAVLVQESGAGPVLAAAKGH
jgi:hypothetical protein